MSRYIDADALKKDVARLHVLNDEAEIRRAYEYNPHVTSTDFEETLVSVFDAIDDAPTIEPKRGEWIPCSERLPSGEDAVLVSTCAFDAIYDVVFMMAEDVERFYECGHVNAWMPSPKPWEGADDE